MTGWIWFRICGPTVAVHLGTNDGVCDGLRCRGDELDSSFCCAAVRDSFSFKMSATPFGGASVASHPDAQQAIHNGSTRREMIVAEFMIDWRFETPWLSGAAPRFVLPFQDGSSVRCRQRWQMGEPDLKGVS